HQSGLSNNIEGRTADMILFAQIWSRQMRKLNNRLFIIGITALFSVAAGAVLSTFKTVRAKQESEQTTQSIEPETAGFKKIQHIIFIIRENHSFDNYFGTFLKADGATSGTISTGQVIPLGHTPDRTSHDIEHSFQACNKAINGGKMD